MFKKRVFLLGTALAAFGAIMAASAIAGPTGDDASDPSAAVGVTKPVVQTTIAIPEGLKIPANGLMQNVGTVTATDVDPNYSMELVSVLITTDFTQSVATCGSPITDDLTSVAPAGTAISPAGTAVATLRASIPTAGTNNSCEIGGAVVTVNVEATGA